MAPRPRSLAERFNEKINKRGPRQPGMRTRCWVWTGAKNGDYGYVSVARSTAKYAHRVAWELANGRKLEEGEVVMHACDFGLCVRPDHLTASTQTDNLHDMSKKGRSYFKKLDADKVRKIRQSSEPHTVLAAEFGVSPSMIRSVRQRTSWKWVD